MAALPPPARAAIRRRCEVVRAEVPEFIAFAPTAADLARLVGVALVATVGSRSPEPRQAGGGRAGSAGGGEVEVLEGVRHLPHLEAPEAFEKVIRSRRRLTFVDPARIVDRPPAARW